MVIGGERKCHGSKCRGALVLASSLALGSGDGVDVVAVVVNISTGVCNVNGLCILVSKGAIGARTQAIVLVSGHTTVDGIGSIPACDAGFGAAMSRSLANVES